MRTSSPTRKNWATWDDSSWRQICPFEREMVYVPELALCRAVMLERRAVSLGSWDFGCAAGGSVSAPNLAAEDAAVVEASGVAAVAGAIGVAGIGAVWAACAGVDRATASPVSFAICAS